MNQIKKAVFLLFIINSLISQSSLFNNNGLQDATNSLSSLLSGSTPKVLSAQNPNSNSSGSSVNSQLTQLLKMQNLSGNGNNGGTASNVFGNLFKQASPQNLAYSTLSNQNNSTTNNGNNQQQVSPQMLAILNQIKQQSQGGQKFQQNSQQQFQQNPQQQFQQQNQNQNLQYQQQQNSQQQYYQQQQNPQQQYYQQQQQQFYPNQNPYPYNNNNQIQQQIDPAEFSPYYFSPLRRQEINDRLGKAKNQDEEDKLDEDQIKKRREESIRRSSWAYRRTYEKSENEHIIEKVQCDQCNSLKYEVCGENGKTYINSCWAKCAAVFYKDGECENKSEEEK